MSVTVNMPQLGESVTEGTVTRWLKQVGDTVQADEPLLEVATDKVDTEIPAPATGVLLEITVQEDETVEVGAALGVIGSPDEAPGGAAPAAPAPAQASPAPAPAAAPPAAPHAVLAAVAVPRIAPDPGPTRSGSVAVPGTETPVVLPALGESVTEGTVTRWLKQVGDQVTADEPLLEVSTDKVDTEIPAPTSGNLLEIRVLEDETAAVGQTLAVIGTPAPAGAAGPARPEPPAPPAPAPTAPAARPTPPQAPAPVQPPAPQHAPVVGAAGSGVPATYVTPLVRRLAEEGGIDLSRVRGTGVGGRITKQDVFDARHAPPAPPAPAPAAARPSAATSAPQATPASPKAAAQPAASAPSTPAPSGTVKMSRLRRVIAERMVESLQTSAQLTTVVEADVTRVAAVRARNKAAFSAREGLNLSFMPFFAKAIIEALRTYPMVNASMDQAAGTVTYNDAIHMGIAVDTERGLLVPVIRDAQNLNIPGLARRIADVAERTRTNKVSPDELSGGTFTLTNTGSRGALFDTPIINQPQVAILGTGAIVRRPVVIRDETGADAIAIRSMIYLALTYDHRLVDGADAARFLTAIRTRLEGGEFEAELS